MMSSEPSRRLKSSTRSESSANPSVSSAFDFTLYGSPAPTCSHRPASGKIKRPSQPPNTPKSSFRTFKPLQLPIERILKLNEKLENTKMEKIKLELSSRQIKLQQDGEDSERCSSRNEGNYLWNSVTRDEESAEMTSSRVDLSIDLSTVTDSDHESDSEDSENAAPPEVMPKKRQYYSSSSCTESPSVYVWHSECNKDCNYPAVLDESIETGYPYSPATQSSGSMNTNRSFSSANICQEYRSPQCFRSKSADLIQHYVRTVDDRSKLTKYFRTCHVCNEACCICPDLVPESSRSFPAIILGGLPGNEPTDSEQRYVDKTTEIDPEILELNKDDPQVLSKDHLSRPDSRNSEFSNFFVERYLNKKDKIYCNNESDLACDSGTSTLQLDDVNASERSARLWKSLKKSIPISVMQLATAAQCARILANSLESVLEIVHDEADDCLKGKELVRFKGDDLNQMFESLLSLKNHFSNREECRNDIEMSQNASAVELDKNWISFDGAGKTEKQDYLSVAAIEELENEVFNTFEDNFDGFP